MSEFIYSEKPPRLVPTQTIIGGAFIFVIGIMTFLASLCIGIAFCVSTALTDWDSTISRDVTVQIRPIEGVNMQDNIQKIIALAKAEKGVKSATLVTEEQQKTLLSPWLGEGIDIGILALPQLIAIELDKTQKPNINALAEKIRLAVSGTSLDDHRIWRDKLQYSASLIMAACILVFILVMLAASLTIAFATRGTLASSRHVVNILNMLGAPHIFIAHEFQMEYFRFGFKGAVLGGGIAMLAFLSFDILEYFKLQPNLEFVLPVSKLSIGTGGYFALFGLIMFVAVLTALISRITTFKLLQNNTPF